MTVKGDATNFIAEAAEKGADLVGHYGGEALEGVVPAAKLIVGGATSIAGSVLAGFIRLFGPD